MPRSNSLRDLVPGAPGAGAVGRLSRRAARRFQHDIWNIGIVHQTAADIVRRGIVSTPRWLSPLPPGRYLADPAHRAHADGSCRLFAEHFDHGGSGSGEIWCADLQRGEDLSLAVFRPLLTFPHHASYPFPIHDGSGRRLMTAETWQTGAALLWEDGEPPQRVGTILSGHALVDPTLWRHEGLWFLFCCLETHNPQDGLFVFHGPSLTGPWEPHPCNPVRRGLIGSRPAGPLFRADGKLIRPGQDCSREYGGAVILHEVTRLDRETYAEVPLRRLDPCRGRYDAGLHTICPAGDVTLIDGKSWRSGIGTRLRRVGRRLQATTRAKGLRWPGWRFGA